MQYEYLETHEVDNDGDEVWVKDNDSRNRLIKGAGGWVQTTRSHSDFINGREVIVEGVTQSHPPIR